MDKQNGPDIFARRMRSLYSAAAFEPKELARHLGVPVPEVYRWMHGVSVPDVYQLREMAAMFGLPCQWFLNEPDDGPSARIMAERLGLSEGTVEMLINFAGEECSEVMDAVDDAIWAVITGVNAVYQDLLCIADNPVKAHQGEG